MKNQINVTPYAKSIGYQGTKNVFVQNGKVVSHKGIEWDSFCARLREQSPPACEDAKALVSNSHH
jgi:hypothetical protein